MKRIKKFKEFVNEGLFDLKSDFVATFGKIISGKDLSSHSGKSEEESLPDNYSPPSLSGGYESLYKSPNLSLSSKYSVASRVGGITRDDSSIFQICLHHTDAENTTGESVISFVYNKGDGYSVHYAIGRDGQLVKGSPHNEKVWASNGLNTHSISIELATGGGIKKKEDKWYDGNNELPEKYYQFIIDLGFEFNGYNYYLDYTDGQMRAFRDFLDMILKEYPEIKKGMKGNVYTEVFGIPEPKEGEKYESKELTLNQADTKRGIFIHAVAPGSDHTDCFPSSKLVNILKEYGYTGNVIESKYLEDTKEIKKENEKSFREIFKYLKETYGDKIPRELNNEDLGKLKITQDQYKKFLKSPYLQKEKDKKSARDISKYLKKIYGDKIPKDLGDDDLIRLGIGPDEYEEYKKLNNKNKSSSDLTVKNIVIGDSLSPNIARCSKADLINKTPGPSSLWKGGIAIGTLLDYVQSYNKIDNNVKNVVISIGTNGIFTRSTNTVNKLVDELKKKFPKAKLLVVKGTYGPKAAWSPALTGVRQETVNNYYADFSDRGVFVVPTAIGNQKDAHSYTDIYKTIGKEIDANLI